MPHRVGARASDVRRRPAPSPSAEPGRAGARREHQGGQGGQRDEQTLRHRAPPSSVDPVPSSPLVDVGEISAPLDGRTGRAAPRIRGVTRWFLLLHPRGVVCGPPRPLGRRRATGDPGHPGSSAAPFTPGGRGRGPPPHIARSAVLKAGRSPPPHTSHSGRSHHRVSPFVAEGERSVTVRRPPRRVYRSIPESIRRRCPHGARQRGEPPSGRAAERTATLGPTGTALARRSSLRGSDHPQE